MKIPRTVILYELIKQLDGNQPICDCDCTINGYFTCIKVHVPKSRGSLERVEVIGYSHDFCDTEFEATDKAAEDLIRSLRRELKFEVDDINWDRMKEHEQDKAYLYGRAERLEHKVVLLNFLVDSLVDGWAFSLKLADLVHNMTNIICESVYVEFGIAVFGEDAKQVIINTMKLKNLAKLAWLEGTNAMRRAVSVET